MPEENIELPKSLRMVESLVHPILGTFRIVDSSNIQALRFDGTEKCGFLEVLFHNGQVWRYGEMPEKDYEDLLNAKKEDGSPNIGRHFNTEIKAKVQEGNLEAKMIYKP
jgi:hypothetical protein